MPLGEMSESQKVFPAIRDLIEGKVGLDLGCGAWKIPGSTGIDLQPGTADIIADVAKGLDSIIGRDGHAPVDYIFSSHLLEDFDIDTQRKFIADWKSHLKDGGLMILYVPEKGKYRGTNMAHKREFARGDVESLMREAGLTILRCVYESEDGAGYSILAIGMICRRQ